MAKKENTVAIIIVGVITFLILLYVCCCRKDNSENYKQVKNAYDGEYAHRQTRQGSESKIGVGGYEHHVNYDADRVMYIDMENIDTRPQSEQEQEINEKALSVRVNETYPVQGHGGKVISDGVGNVYNHRDQMRNEWFDNLGNVHCLPDGSCKLLTTAQAVPANHKGMASMRDRDIRMKEKLDLARAQQNISYLRFLNGGLV